MTAAHSPADLVRDLEMFRERYRRLNRQIAERQAGLEWSTPNRVVFESGRMRLREFEGGDPRGAPLLIVYSHVNRPAIVDLHPEHSLIRCLVEAGQRVFLLDWGEVTGDDRHNALAVYVHDHIHAAVNYLREAREAERINLAGVCQGGTFALCYAAMYPERIARLLPLVTPVDFHAGDSLIAHWIRHIDFSALERSPANVPGEFVTMLFQLMRPFDDMRRQVEAIARADVARHIELMIRMDQWVFDCPDQPGRAFARFMADFYQDNALVRGTLDLGGRQVDLGRIDMPVLNVYAQSDHLVPPLSSAALGDHVTGAYEERVFAGGHIGLLVSKKARQTLLPDIGRWLAGP